MTCQPPRILSNGYHTTGNDILTSYRIDEAIQRYSSEYKYNELDSTMDLMANSFHEIGRQTQIQQFDQIMNEKE